MEVSDAQAIERVLAGDEEAYRLLVDRHSRNLFRLAYRMTGNSEDADDVVQETFLRAYRQMSRFEAKAAVGTWLHRIAVNCAIDLLNARKKRGEQLHEDDDRQWVAVGPEQDERTYGREVRLTIAKAMDALTGNEKTAFVLRHFEGLSIEEIGGILGTRSNATKNTIFRAVRKLREHLEPLVRTTT